MSKRFFSLLLVFCLALSFAAPAFAAADEPAVAKVLDFDADGNASLKTALSNASKLLGMEDYYTPETWASFYAAYDAAMTLKYKFNAGGYEAEVTKAAQEEAAQKLTLAMNLLDDHAMAADIAALQAVVDEATELLKTVANVANGKAELEEAIKTA